MTLDSNAITCTKAGEVTFTFTKVKDWGGGGGGGGDPSPQFQSWQRNPRFLTWPSVAMCTFFPFIHTPPHTPPPHKSSNYQHIDYVPLLEEQKQDNIRSFSIINSVCVRNQVHG